MFKLELNQTQTQLKQAIQSHQVLVSKLKNDSQNTSLKQQLHVVQAQITALSEQQKSIVKLLRKEIVTKSDDSNDARNVSQPQAAHSSPKGVPSSPLTPVPAHQPKKLPVPPENHNDSAASLTPPPQKVAIQSSNENLNIAKSPAQKLPNSASTKKSNSSHLKPSPLKVPHYVAQSPKPSILQGRRSAVLKTIHDNQNSRSTSVQKSDYSTRSNDLKKLMIINRGADSVQKKKLEYMACLDLVTSESLKEMQNKRSERKRRSTANPQFSYSNFDFESHPQQHQAQRQSGGTVAAAPRKDSCAVCHLGGEVLMCDTCSLVYHTGCVDPPLTVIPQQEWTCPKCQSTTKQADMESTLNLVNSYIHQKSIKELEKKKLMKKTEELKAELNQVEVNSKQLQGAINEQIQRRNDLIQKKQTNQKTIESIKSLIQIFQ